MYFEDLTPYQYGGEEPDGAVLNIGWLSRAHSYPRGETSREFIAALQRMVANPVNLYRGSHVCEFCPEPPVTLRNGRKWIEPAPGTTGNGEVRVNEAGGPTYVAPALVLHYIQVHAYLPPEPFIKAVLAHHEAA